MTVRLAGVIDVLDEAYPPGLAQSWDSVGLVCGDPDDVLSSVTIAVDATAAVVDQVPDGGLLLAHHPLLLRGVDTVAASTAKGALVHRLIRSGRSLFTAHTNADSASPGVSDALAHALGLTVEQLTPELANAFGASDARGVLVSEVDSSARKAGVARGDIVTRVGASDVKALDDFSKGAASVKSGSVTLTLDRGGSNYTVTLAADGTR